MSYINFNKHVELLRSLKLERVSDKDKICKHCGSDILGEDFGDSSKIIITDIYSSYRILVTSDGGIFKINKNSVVPKSDYGEHSYDRVMLFNEMICIGRHSLIYLLFNIVIHLDHKYKKLNIDDVEIHHIDSCKENNKLENLVLLKSADHRLVTKMLRAGNTEGANIIIEDRDVLKDIMSEYEDYLYRI